MKYRLPEEAGIAAIKPAPKPERIRRIAQRKRYVITPKQALALGFKLPTK